MDANILQRIVATKQQELARARAQRPLEGVRRAAETAPPPRDFYAAVSAAGAPVRVIAEIKRASPSAGLIREDFDPVAIARTYAEAGAAALSILTDETYFQGSLAFIADVKAAVSLPALRKDFILDDYQVLEARAAGADAILLIAAILTPPQIDAMSRLAAELGMATLLEVHTADELAGVRSLLIPDRRILLGINNRDLSRQVIDLSTTERLAAVAPPSITIVSESGISSAADVRRMIAAGARAILVGETLMRAPDIAARLRSLLS